MDIENQYYNAKGEHSGAVLHRTGSSCSCGRAAEGASKPGHSVAVPVIACLCMHVAGMKDVEDPREAIDGFNQVVDMEGEKGEW